MSGHLPKEPEIFKAIPDAHVGIVASMWHAKYVDRMVERAVAELKKLGVAERDILVHRLPGSAELPLAASLLFQHHPILDGILAFGVVLQGGTTHNTMVLEQVSHGFGLTSHRFGKPIINEVIGVVDLKDADERSREDRGNKGLEAVFAFSEFLTWRRELENYKQFPKIGFGLE